MQLFHTEDRLRLFELAPNADCTGGFGEPPGASRSVFCCVLRVKKVTAENDLLPDAFLRQDDQEIDESACRHWAAYGLHIA